MISWVGEVICAFFLGVTSADGVEEARSDIRFCEGFSKDLFASLMVLHVKLS